MDYSGKSVGELAGKSSHARGRNRGCACHEGADDEVGESPRRAQFRFQEDTAEEGSEESFEHRIVDPGFAKCLLRRHVRLGTQCGGGSQGPRQGVSSESGFADHAAEGCRERAEGPRQLSPRISNTDSAISEDDLGSGNEGAQVERSVVEDALTLGIGGVVQLEATIEEESVDDIRADSTTDVVGGIEDAGLDAGGGEDAGRGKSGESCSDDDDIAARGKREAIDVGHGTDAIAVQAKGTPGNPRRPVMTPACGWTLQQRVGSGQDHPMSRRVTTDSGSHDPRLTSWDPGGESPWARRRLQPDPHDSHHLDDSRHLVDPVAQLRRQRHHQRERPRARRRTSPIAVPRPTRSTLLVAGASSAVTWIIAAVVFGGG